MSSSYINKNIVEIDRDLSSPLKTVTLTGESLSLAEIINVARNDTSVTFTNDSTTLNRVRECYIRMMEDVKNGVPIYGCNTGYGAQASKVLVDGTPEERLDLAKKFSEGIVHVDVTTGPPFDAEVTRAAMLIRINMLLKGVSAVKIEDLDIYRQMLNKGITPIVGQYGGIGASGDLAHNGRVLSAARQLTSTWVWDSQGKARKAAEVLQEERIERLELDPKAGLGFVNGDNFSTGLAALLAYDVLQALLLSSAIGAMANEALMGTDRSFHPLLSNVRAHPGQAEVSMIYRYLLSGSKLTFQEMSGHATRDKGVKIQDAYSLRCLSQYHGVNHDKIKSIFDVITTNANSASDNPLWVTPEHATEGEDPWRWVSGGNFIAMYMVESMDGLRKIMTQIVKLNDRHLARIVNTHENNGLPANLSDKEAITNCAFKGVQIQSGMFDVYSSLLSMPVSTFFGVHEEGNQDITAHSLTSGIMGLENLRLVRYSLAQNLLAICQAIDIRGGGSMLSPRTQPVYEYVRSKVLHVKEERPLHNDIEELYTVIKSGELMSVLRKDVFADLL